MTETVLRNARVVTADDCFEGHVVMRHGVIADVGRGDTRLPAAVDLEGDYLLPGLVELHTDNLEKHMMPRPGVHWDPYAATVVHDAQCAAAGITTVLDAVVLGSRDLGGVRNHMQETAIESLHRCRDDGVLRVAHLRLLVELHGGEVGRPQLLPAHAAGSVVFTGLRRCLVAPAAAGAHGPLPPRRLLPYSGRVRQRTRVRELHAVRGHAQWFCGHSLRCF